MFILCVSQKCRCMCLVKRKCGGLFRETVLFGFFLIIRYADLVCTICQFFLTSSEQYLMLQKNSKLPVNHLWMLVEREGSSRENEGISLWPQQLNSLHCRTWDLIILACVTANAINSHKIMQLFLKTSDRPSFGLLLTSSEFYSHIM